MRLKIPAPVQTWFNTLSTSNKRRPLAEEELDTSLTTNPASPSVATPLVIEALQNLCYEIFALPVCTAHAVTVAQTICGHIYGLAQSTDPSLQLLVLDLLPTLVHVYLVLSSESRYFYLFIFFLCGSLWKMQYWVLFGLK